MQCCADDSRSVREGAVPQKISFKFIDYLKVLYSWIFSFRRTFVFEPGLYFTGDKYDINAPLLVTCNYHMTVFILWRILKLRNTRILVIDTDGINVWCSSGKGRFSAGEIQKQLARYDRDILTAEDKIVLVLPKLSLSGVSIAELKKNSVKPIIGPVYAKDLPAYLDDVPLKNRNNDRYLFSLGDRLFTLVPSLAQIIKYGLYITAGLLIWHHFFSTGIYWQVVPLMAAVVVLYVVFFPILPTRIFAVKGIFLFVVLAIFFSAYYFYRGDNGGLLSYLFYMTFLGGASLFFALSYTGNSGVSNYSLVKQETITYLPATAFFFLASLIIIIIKGVL